MLFNSFEFILLFVPIVLLGFFQIGRLGGHPYAVAWLVAASLFFYGWWNITYVGLIAVSILVNYAVGSLLVGKKSRGGINRAVLFFGVAFNLGLLGYFKYANFFVDNWGLFTGSEFRLPPIILPIAISFFTFQQIAFLVDAYRGNAEGHDFLHYCLFVTFFPQLIAGPIVHHREIFPQLEKGTFYRFRSSHFAVGVTIFSIGLFKKVVLADGISSYSTPVFDAARDGTVLTFFEAWGGATAYTLQLYFDFSGYSDMAIGLARLFGLRLPLNFNSPYKAVNIIEFWRRWHITLSRFLRDYLYFSLGGNRKGPARRYVNVLITMLLGGLWHGAGWTFVLWGGIHGVFLAVNHAWRSFRNLIGLDLTRSSFFGRGLSRAVTFLSVVTAWVIFRAENISSAESMLRSMVGLNGVALSKFPKNLAGLEGWLTEKGVQFNGMFQHDLVDGPSALLWLGLLLIVAWFAPNTQQIMHRYRPGLGEFLRPSFSRRWFSPAWRPNLAWGLTIAFAAALSVIFIEIKTNAEFLYFQF